LRDYPLVIAAMSGRAGTRVILFKTIRICCSPVYLDLADQSHERRERYIEFVVDSSIINSERSASRAFIGSEEFVSKLNQETWGRFGDASPVFGKKL